MLPTINELSTFQRAQNQTYYRIGYFIKNNTSANIYCGWDFIRVERASRKSVALRVRTEPTRDNIKHLSAVSSRATCSSGEPLHSCKNPLLFSSLPSFNLQFNLFYKVKHYFIKVYVPGYGDFFITLLRIVCFWRIFTFHTLSSQRIFIHISVHVCQYRSWTVYEHFSREKAQVFAFLMLSL